ncbi:hypothetical protein AcV7_010007 [Taiwanofungus camphoratus]|nr:hypothetical protein AcV7_010007 [Antrodia cinnamomea]
MPGRKRNLSLRTTDTWRPASAENSSAPRPAVCAMLRFWVAQGLNIAQGTGGPPRGELENRRCRARCGRLFSLQSSARLSDETCAAPLYACAGCRALAERSLGRPAH